MEENNYTCIECGITKHTSKFYPTLPRCISCIINSKAKLKNTGKEFILKSGEKVIIIKYNGRFDCTIKTESGVVLEGVSLESLHLGWAKNPMTPVICGIGYIGIGNYNSKDNKKYYNVWSHVIRRCYDNKFILKYPTYKDVTVCEEWHNFQNFAAWYEENYKEGFHLDKDILCKDCKIYSPETCAFVPVEINNFIKGSHKDNGLPKGVIKTNNATYQVILCGKYLGVYKTIEQAFQICKTARENHIKTLAEKWHGKIEERVYQAMINYNVEITD